MQLDLFDTGVCEKTRSRKLDSTVCFFLGLSTHKGMMTTLPGYLDLKRQVGKQVDDGISFRQVPSHSREENINSAKYHGVTFIFDLSSTLTSTL